MPIAVGPVVFKSTHQGAVRALCNILNITISHDHPHGIINTLIQLHSYINNSYEHFEMEIKHYEYSPMSVWLGANYGFTLPPFPWWLFASGAFNRSRESPVIQCSIAVGPVSWANAVLDFENNSIVSMGSALQNIVFVMIIVPFRVRCYRHTQHIWTVLLHRGAINRV